MSARTQTRNIGLRSNAVATATATLPHRTHDRPDSETPPHSALNARRSTLTGPRHNTFSRQQTETHAARHPNVNRGRSREIPSLSSEMVHSPPHRDWTHRSRPSAPPCPNIDVTRSDPSAVTSAERFASPPLQAPRIGLPHATRTHTRTHTQPRPSERDRTSGASAAARDDASRPAGTAPLRPPEEGDEDEGQRTRSFSTHTPGTTPGIHCMLVH